MELASGRPVFVVWCLAPRIMNCLPLMHHREFELADMDIQSVGYDLVKKSINRLGFTN